MKKILLPAQTGKNLNGRVYGDVAREQIVGKINRSEVFVCRPDSTSDSCVVNLRDVVGFVKDAEVDERGDVVAEVEMLDRGNDVKALLKKGLAEVRCRGLGCVDSNGLVSNYELISADVVLKNVDAFRNDGDEAHVFRSPFSE